MIYYGNYITRSLHLFLELCESPTDEEHVQTYLWLGRSYKDRGRSQDIRACYEMGLLIALNARNLHSKYCQRGKFKMRTCSIFFENCIVLHYHILVVSGRQTVQQ